MTRTSDGWGCDGIITSASKAACRREATWWPPGSIQGSISLRPRPWTHARGGNRRKKCRKPFLGKGPPATPTVPHQTSSVLRHSLHRPSLGFFLLPTWGPGWWVWCGACCQLGQTLGWPSYSHCRPCCCLALRRAVATREQVCEGVSGCGLSRGVPG